MGLKGQTGTSLGGGIVGRKQLKAQRKPELPPVDPRTLTAEARARRDAYAAEAEARKQAAITAQGARDSRQAQDRSAAAAQGRRIVPLSGRILTHGARRGEPVLTAEEKDARARAQLAARKEKVQADRAAGLPPKVTPKRPRSQKGAPVVKWKNTKRENGL